eukprot:238739_1
MSTITTKDQCFKCQGRGWVHESGIKHDTSGKEEDERCFHCEDCTGCEGKGYLENTKIVPHNEQVTVTTSQQKNACFKCEGKGWNHESGIAHNKEDDERCFHCEDCNACDGKGYLESTQETQKEEEFFEFAGIKINKSVIKGCGEKCIVL